MSYEIFSSLDASRHYCQFMVSTCHSATPTIPNITTRVTVAQAVNMIAQSTFREVAHSHNYTSLSTPIESVTIKITPSPMLVTRQKIAQLFEETSRYATKAFSEHAEVTKTVLSNTYETAKDVGTVVGGTAATRALSHPFSNFSRAVIKNGSLMQQLRDTTQNRVKLVLEIGLKGLLPTVSCSLVKDSARFSVVKQAKSCVSDNETSQATAEMFSAVLYDASFAPIALLNNQVRDGAYPSVVRAIREKGLLYFVDPRQAAYTTVAMRSMAFWVPYSTLSSALKCVKGGDESQLETAARGAAAGYLGCLASSPIHVIKTTAEQQHMTISKAMRFAVSKKSPLFFFRGTTYMGVMFAINGAATAVITKKSN